MSVAEMKALHAKGTADRLRAALQAVPVDRRPSYEKARIVLSYLADSYRPGRGYLDESVGQIADATGLGARTVDKVMKALDTAGITTQIRRSCPGSAPRRTLPFLVPDAVEHNAVDADEHNAVRDGTQRGSDSNTTRYDHEHNAVDRVPPHLSPGTSPSTSPSLSSRDEFKSTATDHVERENPSKVGNEDAPEGSAASVATRLLRDAGQSTSPKAISAAARFLSKHDADDLALVLALPDLFAVTDDGLRWGLAQIERAAAPGPKALGTERLIFDPVTGKIIGERRRRGQPSPLLSDRFGPDDFDADGNLILPAGASSIFGRSAPIVIEATVRDAPEPPAIDARTLDAPETATPARDAQAHESRDIGIGRTIPRTDDSPKEAHAR
jgi:DNA-binding transcriptional ArsR family regulator